MLKTQVGSYQQCNRKWTSTFEHILQCLAAQGLRFQLRLTWIGSGMGLGKILTYRAEMHL